MVVLGVTGCIGAYKACEVLRELQARPRRAGGDDGARDPFRLGDDVRGALRASLFVDQFALGAESDIRHISLADAADLLLVARHGQHDRQVRAGIADDALSTLFLATKAPVLVAPAMNVNMFEHPGGAGEHRGAARARRAVRRAGLGLPGLRLAGEGRLAEVADIVAAALGVRARRQSLAGQTVVVTAGPTVEDIDPVRFVSNRSSGRMGYRLAEAARDRGARVVLVSGPTALTPPGGVEIVNVRSAEEMARAVDEHARGAAAVVMAAAVSDYHRRRGRRRRSRSRPGPRTSYGPPTSHVARSGQGRAVPGRLRGGDDRPPRTPAGSARRRTWT